MSGTRPQVMSWLRIISRDDLQLQSGCAFRAESRLVSSLSLNPSASQLQYGPIPVRLLMLPAWGATHYDKP